MRTPIIDENSVSRLPKVVELDDSLPKWEVFAVFLVLTGSFFSSAVIFPFVPFMVHDFYPELSKTQLGTRSGFLGSAYYLGRVFSGVAWGNLADRFGRKPTLLIGLFFTIGTTVAFGLSPSYYFALVTRFLWGAFSGNISIGRTILYELSNKKNRSRAISVVGYAVTIGRLCGATLGGVLAQPADKMKFFDTPFFREYKYSLPVFTAAFLNITGLIAAVCILPETMDQPTIQGAFDYSQVDDEKIETLSQEEISIQRQPKKSSIGTNPIRENSQPVTPKRVPRNLKDSPMFGKPVISPENTDGSTPTAQRNTGLHWSPSLTMPSERFQDTDETICSVWCRPIVLLTTFMRCFVGFAHTLYMEVFPLWVLNDKHHYGFNFGTTAIGAVRAISTPFDLLLLSFGFTKIVDTFGNLKAFRIFSFLWFLITMGTPFVYLLNTESDTTIWVGIVGVTILQNWASIVVLQTNGVFTSNAAEKEVRGTVNGIAQAITGVGRGLGPTVAGVLFSWSLDDGRHTPYPLGFYTVFTLSAAFIFFIFLLSFCLDKSIESNPRERLMSEQRKMWDAVDDTWSQGSFED